MNDVTPRIPVKSLVDLKMTHWYLSRRPVIQQAINNYPPGYYIFSGNGEVYRLTGWSDPEEKRGETEVHVYLEREILGGTERLRISPIFMSPEEEILELARVQEDSNTYLSNNTPRLIGYNVGKNIEGNTRFLTDSSTGERRFFTSIQEAEGFILAHNIATEEELSTFVFESLYNI